VHLCVVDPGVGSARAAIGVLSRGHVFIAPDNGLLTGVLTDASDVRRVDTERLGLTPPSRTFHGRDVFAPVAAWLASGQRRFDQLGESHQPQLLPMNEPKRLADGAVGRVRAVDHFGNLITDLPGAWLAEVEVQATLGERRLRSVGTYAEALPGECVALRSSFETWEIAQRDGSAATALGAGVGSIVTLHVAGAQSI
jgi:S-adenosylmethionine hydrolase